MLSLLVATALAAPVVPTCVTPVSPFDEPGRERFSAVEARVASRFGDGRVSYVRGHLHAGVDLRGQPGQAVYAMCDGRVADIHLGSPHRTVVVAHQLPEGAVVYTSYKHIEDLAVAVGDRVDPQTRLGRLFTPEEQRAAPWSLTHVHLELRVDISDGGAASWTSMSRAELERYAADPLRFLRDRMQTQGRQ